MTGKPKTIQDEIQLYREIVENMAEGVFLIRSRDSVIVYTNSTAERIFGYEMGELVGKPTSILNAPTDKSPEEIDWEIRQSLNANGVWHGEVKNIQKEGTTFWCQVNVSTLEHPQYGSVWIAINQDITERKKVEKERESLLAQVTAARDEVVKAKNQLNGIMERVSDGIVAFDKDFNYTYVNTRGGALLGRKADELIGKNYWIEYPEARGTPFANAYVRAMETQQPIVFEDYYEHWDRWFVNRIYPSQEGITIFFNEITERKRAEESLRASEEKYRDIFENATEGIFQSTPDGGFRSVNSAMARIFGYETPEDMITSIGNNIATRIHVSPDNRAEFMHALEENGVVRGFEAQNLRKNGSLIWTRTSARAIRDANGKVLYYEGFLEDITESRRAEDALRESEERLRQIIEQMPYPVEICDPSGTAKMVNQAFLNMFDIPTADLVVDKYNVFNDSMTMDVLGLEKDIRRVYAGEWVFIPELTFPMITQPEFGIQLTEDIVLETTMFPVFRDNGEIWRVVTIWKDITQRKRVERNLYRREQEYKTLVEHTPDVIVRFDRQYRHIYVNPAVENEFGTPPDALLGRTHRELGQPPEMADWSEGFIRQIFETGQEVTFELDNPTPAGFKHYFSRGVPEFAEDGSVRSVLFIHHNITDRKKAEKELRQSRMTLSATLDALPDLLFEIDFEGRFYDFRAPDSELLFVEPTAFLGKTIHDVLPPDAATVIARSIEDAAANGRHTGTIYTLPMPNGTRWFELSIAAKKDPFTTEERFIVLARDITLRKRTEEALREANEILRAQLNEIQSLHETLREQAIRDSLTGLHNRRYLYETMIRELARAKREGYSVGVMMIDIDHFKDFNDTHGHQAGDEVLVALGALLRNKVRQGDIACRYGGEEFIVIMPGAADNGDVERRANAIRRDFDNLRINCDGTELQATISIGVAYYPHHGDDMSEIIKGADAALYEAKQAGRNCVRIWKNDDPPT
jgi:diguanylate cyclase (GGDEF)-like protein/PAS domain S-box-containing protein